MWLVYSSKFYSVVPNKLESEKSNYYLVKGTARVGFSIVARLPASFRADMMLAALARTMLHPHA